MKKLLTAFAASAVAVSMLAFAGCGGNNGSAEGEIPGNYEEKTPEQITEIIDGIDTDKIFGEIEAGETAAVNMGVKVNIQSNVSMGELYSANGSVNLDYKVSTSENSTAGTGTFAVNATYSGAMMQTAGAGNIDVSGTFYNDAQYAYAVIGGKTLGGDMKAKINMEEILESFINSGTGDVVSPSVATAYAASDAMSVSSILAMAQAYNVSVSIDDSDGVKFKLSATEDTFWKGISEVLDGTITEAQIDSIKELVTFNTFKFDVYFALDSEGAFAGASVVMDIDVTADGSLMTIIMGSVADADDAAAVEMPNITAKVSGSVQLYTHSDTVEVPASVTGDSAYTDMTQTILGMINNMM